MKTKTLKPSAYGSYSDIDGWEDGIPDFGPPAANPHRLGKTPMNVDRDQARLERANQIRAKMGLHPLDEMGVARRKPGPVKGTTRRRKGQAA